MGKRHRMPSGGVASARRTLIIGGAVIAAVAVVFAGVRLFVNHDGGCSGQRAQLVVGADPSIVGPVHALLDAARPDACADFQLQEATAADLLQVVNDRGVLPDLWVPASPVESERVSRDAQLPFTTILNTVASSPVVIAANEINVDDSTWASALATPGLRVADPARSGISDAAILSAAAEVEDAAATQQAVMQSMAGLAQAQNDVRPGETEAQVLQSLPAGPGAVVVTEKDFVSQMRDRGNSGIRAVVPRTGAGFLTYPLVVSTQDAGRRTAAARAGEALVSAATAPDFAGTLAASGFRGADRAPLPNGAGVGEQPRLVVRDAGALDRTLRTWRLLSLPSNSVALVDASESMNLGVPGTGMSRINLMTQVLNRGLDLFPDSAALGLWSFNSAGKGGGEPFTKLAPLARNDTKSAQGTQRDVLRAAINELPQHVGGGTDLYTSVLAAMKYMRENYNPNAINSVLLFSDGANDAASPITQEQFVQQVQATADPARPVIVVCIGILEDADPAVLDTIARATGGSSHIARTAQEITTVFADAIARRGVGGQPGTA